MPNEPRLVGSIHGAWRRWRWPTLLVVGFLVLLPLLEVDLYFLILLAGYLYFSVVALIVLSIVHLFAPGRRRPLMTAYGLVAGAAVLSVFTFVLLAGSVRVPMFGASYDTWTRGVFFAVYVALAGWAYVVGLRLAFLSGVPAKWFFLILYAALLPFLFLSVGALDFVLACKAEGPIFQEQVTC